MHLVDLDAAFGTGSNSELIAEVVGRLDIPVELSGGITDDDSLEAALATGCARVNIGTAALGRHDWVRSAIVRHGEKVAVGLDVRGTTVSARGGPREGGELFDVLAQLDADGCARYVVTDVLRDGMLSGPNLDLLRRVCAATARPVIASGGVSSPRRPLRARRPRQRRSRGCNCRRGAVRRRVHVGKGACRDSMNTRPTPSPGAAKPAPCRPKWAGLVPLESGA